jgi:hypothetical protein
MFSVSFNIAYYTEMSKFIELCIMNSTISANLSEDAMDEPFIIQNFSKNPVSGTFAIRN